MGNRPQPKMSMQQRLNTPDEDVELLDSERIAMAKVRNDMNERAQTGGITSMDAFNTEAMDRFFNLGFYIEVSWKTEEPWHGAESERPWYPEILVTGRVEESAEGFDHDKMGHEVRSNILGLKGQDNVQNKQVAGGFGGGKRTGSGLIVPG